MPDQKKLHFGLIFLLLICGLTYKRVSAAEWQFAVNTSEKNGRAFLWIPPGCQKLRGLIIGQQVILEKIAFESPQIRTAASDQCLGMILIISPVFKDFDEKGNGAGKLQKVLDDLAEISGYTEISQVPIFPLGHSGGAIPAWNLCYWKPQKCFGLIGLKAAPIHPPAYAPNSNVDGVPVLVISGQYETWGNPSGVSAEYHWRWVRGSLLEFRAIGRNPLMSELVEPGATHFGWSDELANYTAMFIRKAAQYRIPKDTPLNETPKLKEISNTTGWLTDPTFLTPPRYLAAAFAKYGGDPVLAFWHFDEEIARANENFGKAHKNKKLQMLTFVDNGQPLVTQWLEELKFQPVNDGMTVKVAADFLTETPPEMSFPEKKKLSHAANKIKFRLLGGWSGGGEQLSEDTFRIKFDRFGITKPSGTLMITAYHDGDKDFAYAEQAAQIKFPIKNTNGLKQTITFNSIGNQTVNFLPIPLKAVSDSGLPVEFCIMAGPAEISGNVLRITKIPPRTKFPVKVTVAAYQWGRSSGNLVQSAETVLQDFYLTKN